MDINLINLPIFIESVSNHKEIKDTLLDAIESMGSYSFINKDQHISNTDWHLGSNFNRPYWGVFNPIVIDHNEKIKTLGNYNIITTANYWFQQYKKGDYHNMHCHGDVAFSNVYFLELPEGSSKTCFNIQGKEVYFDVKEGDIITFPGILMHESKPNQSDKRKTVIVYNSTVR